ncbi:hypothetical protein STANM309S_06276 [Streptomyces tanashiensis]
MWVMPISLQALNMSFSRAAPSSSEYWVWTWRCVKAAWSRRGPPENVSDWLGAVWGDSVEVYVPGLTAVGHSGLGSRVRSHGTPVRIA